MTLRSISIEVHDMDRMARFWSEAIGVDLKEVVTRGRGAWFGTLYDGTTLKLMDASDRSVRDRDIIVLGLAVPDVDGVVEFARELGGELVGEVLRHDGRCHARVRDPDGNLLELYTR